MRNIDLACNSHVKTVLHRKRSLLPSETWIKTCAGVWTRMEVMNKSSENSFYLPAVVDVGFWKGGFHKAWSAPARGVWGYLLPEKFLISDFFRSLLVPFWGEIARVGWPTAKSSHLEGNQTCSHSYTCETKCSGKFMWVCEGGIHWAVNPTTV